MDMQTEKRITEFYDTKEYLRRRFRELGRQLPFDAENAAAWQTEARAKLRELLALDQLLPCDPQPELTETVQLDGCRRERWLLQTEPGVRMPFFALIPDGIAPGEKRPAFIMPHGHGLGGKISTVDARDYTEYAEIVARFPPAFRDGFNYAKELVKAGYLVFAPDARGAGERREWMHREPKDFGANSHGPLGNVAMSLGLSLIGMMVWDLMRLMDFVLARPDIDGRVACAGMSGGGHQTLFFTAADERVCGAVIAGWFYGFESSFVDLSQNCACNFSPNLWRYFDCGDIGALIAPRPVLIESGKNDPLNGPKGIDNVYEQVKVARQAQVALGDEDRLWHEVHDGGHEWRGLRAMEFARTYLPI